MARLIATLGNIPARYRYGSPELLGKDHISLYRYEVKGIPYKPNVFLRKPCACILPIDAENREVWLLKQMRLNYALATRPMEAMPFVVPSEEVLMWEAPAGAIEAGETGPKAAVRELFEETGLIVHARHLTLVQRAAAPSMGGCTEVHQYFFADIEPQCRVDPVGDGTEAARIWAVGFEEAFAMLDAGEIVCGNTSNLLRELRIRLLRDVPIF